MFIDYLHWRLCTLMEKILTKLLGSLPQNDWWHIPCIAGPALGNSKILEGFQRIKRGALPWSSTLEGPSFAANILNKKDNTKKHRHRVVAIFFAIFFKTKSHKARQARLTFNCDGSIQGTSQQPKLFGFIFLAMSSVQLWRSSGAWDLFKATQKNKCGTIVLHISQLSHRGSDGTNKGPLSFDCFGIIEMPKKDPLEKQNMSTCHVMKNQLWRVDLFLL